MAFVRAAHLSQIQPGWVYEASIDGRTYAVANNDGELFCLDGDCPCTGGPLGRGALRGGLVVCPWHGWRYDCKTGICAYDDSIRIPRYAVKIQDDEVWIDVSNPL